MQLAPELDYFPAVCPWLSRIAGALVLRPQWYHYAVACLNQELDTVATAFAAMLPTMQQAAASIQAFGAALEKAPIGNNQTD